MDLTERKKQILKRVVEDYIAAAEPVGSKALAEEMGGSVSSATIRNELADLVEMGYLEQPHTSAGRVPSPKGYRLYVNELMEKREVSEAEAEEINEQLKSKLSGTDSVIAKAGQMVSSIVNYPVYSVTGGRREASVKRFELIAVDAQSFIVVMMGEDNRVKSQLQHSDLPFDAQRLADVKELLNAHFTACGPDEMSARLMSLSEQLSPELFLVVSKAVEYAISMLEQSAQRSVETAGASLPIWNIPIWHRKKKRSCRLTLPNGKCRFYPEFIMRKDTAFISGFRSAQRPVCIVPLPLFRSVHGKTA